MGLEDQAHCLRRSLIAFPITISGLAATSASPPPQTPTGSLAQGYCYFFHVVDRQDDLRLSFCLQAQGVRNARYYSADVLRGFHKVLTVRPIYRAAIGTAVLGFLPASHILH